MNLRPCRRKERRIKYLHFESQTNDVKSWCEIQLNRGKDHKDK